MRPSVVALIENNLAMVHLDRCESAKAESLIQSALERIEAAKGKEHPLVIEALIGLGDCEVKFGKLSQAKAHYHRAAMIAAKRLLKRHPVHSRIRSRLLNADRLRD